MLPYSSGTTGTAKGVMITHHSAVAMLAQLESLAPDVSGRSWLAVLPFFHAYGLHILLNGTLRRGTLCVTMPRFDLEQFLRSSRSGESRRWRWCRHSSSRWRSTRSSIASTCRR
jgi:acyl-CoA synthetase (AMP-forming)/AMP-acid ligase II